jgi:hypothetical protein
LTLTIDAFDPKGDVGGDAKVAGDYSAVFPLLTVAVFVSQQVSRNTIFYEKQRSRGDIMALPEVLCEPGKVGKPLVMDYDGHPHDYDYKIKLDQKSSQGYRTIDDCTTEQARERMYVSKKAALRDFPDSSPNRPFQHMRIALAKDWSPPSESWSIREDSVDWESPCSPGQQDAKISRMPSQGSPIDDQPKSQKKLTHRRSFSAPYGIEQSDRKEESTLKQGNSTIQIEKRGHRRCGSGSLVRVESFGLVDQEQPSLLDQARLRAASLVSQDRGHQSQKQAIMPPPSMPAGRRRRASFDFEESDIPFFI